MQRNGERLYMGPDGEDKSHVPKILGMRGLSMKRLEQLLNLRQRCQSFAKLENRFHTQFLKDDFNPPDSVPRDEVDDVCPLLLDRSNRLREQRVYQTAHLILAEALGMKSKNPAEVNNKKARRVEVDLHGEYERRKDKDGNIFPRCSVIVLENLERYKTSQERTRTENSRLMKWAHRAIVEKLEDMCKPFGITIMLVDPAFSSRFDSFTGLPGVRVNSVSRGFDKQYPYNKWVNDKTKKGDDTQLARDIKSLVKLFESNQQYKDTLLLAVEGGKEFLSVRGSNKDIQNADINAAVNIGLRAVADPRRFDIFPRLRTKQLADGKVQVLNWRGVFGQFGKGDERRRLVASPLLKAAVQSDTSDPDTAKKMKKQKKGQGQTEPTEPDNDAESSTQSSEFPPFFVQAVEFAGMPQDEAFEAESNELPAIRAFSQGLFLKRVECLCNERIQQINFDRVKK
jgi:IS605 OrfB family transposase